MTVMCFILLSRLAGRLAEASSQAAARGMLYICNTDPPALPPGQSLVA